MQFNYLLEKGAIREGSTEGTFAVNWDTFADGIRDLLRELCVLQARGDYPGTSELLERYGVLSPALERGIARLEEIPVDVLPSYPAAEGRR